MTRLSSSSLALLLVGSLLMAACSSSKETTNTSTPPPTERVPAPERLPPSSPASPKPVTRTVQGFRIQLLNTPDKAAAEERLAQADAWWRSLPASERPDYLGEDALDVDIVWQQPYYRVRAGAFADRVEAQRALSIVERTFPETFIVPSLVTITRLP